MRGNPDELALEHFCREAVRRSLGPMRDSSVFLAIMSDNFERDALAVMQFGLAVLIDKPIHLLLRKGTVLNENVRRLARSYEYFDPAVPGSLEAATAKLMAAAGVTP
jgi:hypothetical protein